MRCSGKGWTEADGTLRGGDGYVVRCCPIDADLLVVCRALKLNGACLRGIGCQEDRVRILRRYSEPMLNTVEDGLDALWCC